MQLSSWLIFRLCLTLHTISALWNIINDCDETFNYWEPLHHLLHGTGFQTWEYSPLYSLRSYLYLCLYAPPAVLIGWLGGSRVTQFYAIRFWMAFWTAAAETAAFDAVKRRIDKSLPSSVCSIAFAVFSATSAGLFVSCTAFLPSSFAMQLAYVYLAAWLTDQLAIAVFCVAAMAIVGWPFAAALGLPLVVDLVLLRRKLVQLCVCSIAAGLTFAIPVGLIDTLVYGRLTLSPLNLLSYNVLNSVSHLYGTAPMSYYAMNYALNFSPLVVPLLIAGFLSAKSATFGKGRQVLLLLSPLILWNLVFFLQSHKEERFLYPCYPFLCLAMAIALECLRRRFGGWTAIFILTAFVALSASRIAALTLSYQSHVTIYHRLSLHSPPGRLCLGKEWYRFPSAFLLPNNWTVGFVQSEFRGQLPGRFGLNEQKFNLENREEIDRYLNVSTDCDYLIDKRSGAAGFTELEPDYANQRGWQLLEDLPFLDPELSHRLFRAFYVPGLFERYVRFASYVLLRRVT